MSNTFPASLSAFTSTGEANISGDFEFALDSNKSKSSHDGALKNLTILWSETVSDEVTGEGLMTAAHSELKAARLLATDTNSDNIVDDFSVSAPQLVAELPENTLVNHFDAYVAEGWNYVKTEHPIQAVIQATHYDQSEPVEVYDAETGTTVKLPSEETQLYTATHNFKAYRVEVEAIGVDYANLMANSLTPIQFTVRNTGVNQVTDLAITLGEDETATSTTLAPNESATLTVYHKLGETARDVGYTITGNGVTGNNATGRVINQSGTVYLAYPDVGISQMKVLEENEGQRTIALTLYNASDAPLADSGRKVQVAFYTDSLLTEKAQVTYNNSESDTITISDNAALQRIDAGGLTLVLTYNVKDYVESTLSEEEIPDSGVYLYADAWAEGAIGNTRAGSQRLPEVHSSDNQAAVLLTGAYARTGQETTLDVVQTNGATTTATVSLRNNKLQPQTTATLVTTLVDDNGTALETETTSITGTLNGEATQTSTVHFKKSGARVVVHAAAAGKDSLAFDGLPVSLDSFTPGEDGTYTYAISGVSATGTLVTAISGNGGAVTINGTAYTGGGSQYVAIGAGETVITVQIGGKTYTLSVTSTQTEPGGNPGGGGGGTVTRPTYPPTVSETEDGTVAVSPTRPHQGDKVTITATPDEGYKVGEVIVTKPDGEEVAVTGQGGGKYTFTQPSGKVTIHVAFVPEDWRFTDVPADQWYFGSVKYVFEHGIMEGMSPTIFSPNSNLTRAQVVQILYNLDGKPEASKASTFTDLVEEWYKPAIAWAESTGVVQGYGDGTFRPGNAVTREEFARMMYNYAAYKGYDLTAKGDLSRFPDGDKVDLWAQPAMTWANGCGLINGHDDGTLEPKGTTTRGQAAAVLMRFHQNVAKQ